VLLVDDEPLMLRAMRRSLRHLPVEVGAAMSAEQALAMLEEGPFDLVISDLRLPGMDGLALLGWLHERWPGAHGVLLTGRAPEVLPASWPGSEPPRVLLKPCGPAVIRALVRDLLDLEPTP